MRRSPSQSVSRIALIARFDRPCRWLEAAGLGASQLVVLRREDLDRRGLGVGFPTRPGGRSKESGSATQTHGPFLKQPLTPRRCFLGCFLVLISPTPFVRMVGFLRGHLVGWSAIHGRVSLDERHVANGKAP